MGGEAPPRAAGLPDLPAGFAHRMAALLGDEAADLLAALEAPPVRGLRVNTLKAAPESLVSRLPWLLSRVAWCAEGFAIEDPQGEAGRHPLHAAGAYYLQDPSAMAPAAALAPQPGERVCDLAAAPGGKTTHLAARMAGRGLLVANDLEAARARALLGNVERWGAPHVVVTQSPPERLARAWPEAFDRVLLDAPCSGEGMFRKSAEARRQWTEGRVARCAAGQARLLDHASRLVREGGLLAYSTCTFEPDENEGAVAAFLARHEDFALETLALAGAEPGMAPPGAGLPPLAGTVRLWPHRVRGDGHFVALLRRTGPERLALPRPHASRAGSHAAVSDAPASAVSAYRAFADAYLDGDPFPEARLLLHEDRLLAAPAALGEAPGVHVVRAGVLLGRLRTGRFEPAHALAMAAPPRGSVLSLAPDDPRLARYLSGEPLEQPSAGAWSRVAVEGLPLGWARADGRTLRSLLPRGLRRPQR